MDPRFQRRVRRYGWDKASASYEQYWHRQLAPAQKRLLEMAELAPGDRVLDIACGTGLVTSSERRRPFAPGHRSGAVWLSIALARTPVEPCEFGASREPRTAGGPDSSAALRSPRV